MKKHHIKLFISMLFVFLIFTGCNKNTSSSSSGQNISNEKLTIAVSIVPEESFVKEIAGDLVNVITMIPPGKSPENFAPTPELIQNFSNASLYFTIGVPSESSYILPKVKDLNDSLKIVSLDKEVLKHYDEHKFESGERDPHIWLSPKRTIVMVETIKNELCNLDPKNKDTYEKNSANYIKKISELDQYLSGSLSKLNNKSFICYHPSLGYLAEDYGLKMISLEKEGKEATPQDFKEVIDFAKQNNIKVIFYQAEVDSKQSKAFAEEINGTSELIVPLSPDYINNLKKTADTFLKVLN